MIRVREIARLEVAAASGLVVDGDTAWVVADDELFLDGYDLASGRRTRRLMLFAQDAALPEEPGARKRRKPDLEALARLPDGRLLAMPSGSTAARTRGALVSPATEPPDVRLVELALVLEAIAGRVGRLNLEGAAVAGDRLRLLQRRTAAADAWSAVVDLDLAATLAGIAAGAPLDGALVRDVRCVDLGALGGVPLAFTDATPFGGGRLLFTAAAEDTLDPYADGRCAGSVVGLLDADGAVTRVEPLDTDCKVEGIAVAADGRVLLVADADDRAQPAPLLEADLSGW